MNPETESIFEKLVVEGNLVTQDQLAEAKRLRAESPSATLLDLLIEKGYGDAAKLKAAAELATMRSGSERVSIAGFELLEKIGQGGMGAVYRASQVNIGRFVALKLMRPALAKDKRYLERFLREARASAKLSHPNIVQGIDAGQDKGYYYFAMEFVDGQTLRRIIKDEGRLSERRCLEIGAQIALALDHAARFNMVHRDVKPENILIERATGVAKLADLGLIKSLGSGDSSLTQAGIAIGTPNYISPEQACGDETIDIRTDIYSLGASLYHAVTGTVPFSADSAPVMMSMHMQAPLEPPHRRHPEVSPWFSQVIQKMMAKDRGDRYQTPAEVLADLERIMNGEAPAGAEVKPAAVRAPGKKRAAKKSNRLTPIVVALVIAAIVLGVRFVLMPPPIDEEATKRAKAAGDYKRAVDLIAVNPTNFKEIVENLKNCLDLDPQGPEAERAAELIRVAESFRKLVNRPTENRDARLGTITALAGLAAQAPTDPPYATGIHNHMARMSRDLITEIMGEVVSDPAKAPEAAGWLDAVAKAASDDEVAAEVRTRKGEVARILRDNVDHILDRFAQEAEDAAGRHDYKKAIAILRSSVPEGLMTPQLRALIEKKVERLRVAAAGHADELRGQMWAALDEGDLRAARACAAAAKTRLDLPELKPELAELGRTADAAEGFLPLLDRLRELEADEPADDRAIGEAALKVREEFGTDAYVGRRLRKYEAAIESLLRTREVEARILEAARLIEEKKYADADECIARILDTPGLTEDARREAAGLRVRLAPEYRLGRMMAAGLESALPLNDVRLALADGTELRGSITALSKDGFEARVAAGDVPVRWDMLDYYALRGLAFGRPALVNDEDPAALYCLGVLAVEKDPDECRKLLRAAVEQAGKKTESELPERTALIQSANDCLGRLIEADAEKALKTVAGLVAGLNSSGDIDRAVSAYTSFKRQYGATAYARSNDAAVAKIADELVDALLRDRARQAAQLISDGAWAKIVAILERALDDAAQIAPVPEKRREVIDGLIEFGRGYVAEDAIFRAVFSVRPWRGERLDALKRDENELVAERAKRYAAIFGIRVHRRPTAEEQREYVRQEWNARKKKKEPVRDVYDRLARCNAVFVHWRGAFDECDLTELEAARNFRGTGGTGNTMSIILMENFIKYRRKAAADTRAQAEMERLTGYVRAAGKAPLFRLFAAAEARKAMVEYRSVGNFIARFCLVAAQQYEAAGDDENAAKYYGSLCSLRSKYPDFAWRGYLGRGRARERVRKYEAALSDYEAALANSSGWSDGYICAKAIADLCLHSGKYRSKSSHARTAVNELLKRSGSDALQKRARELLEPKKD